MKNSNISAEQLKSIIERVERLNEEKAAITSDISDIFSEAAGNGFDKKTIRLIIKQRAKDASERDEEDHLYDTYARAIGLLPLFEDDAA